MNRTARGETRGQHPARGRFLSAPRAPSPGKADGEAAKAAQPLQAFRLAAMPHRAHASNIVTVACAGRLTGWRARMHRVAPALSNFGTCQLGGILENNSALSSSIFEVQAVAPERVAPQPRRPWTESGGSGGVRRGCAGHRGPPRTTLRARCVEGARHVGGSTQVGVRSDERLARDEQNERVLREPAGGWRRRRRCAARRGAAAAARHPSASIDRA